MNSLKLDIIENGKIKLLVTKELVEVSKIGIKYAIYISRVY